MTEDTIERVLPSHNPRAKWAWMAIALPLVLTLAFVFVVRDSTPRYAFMVVDEAGAPVRWNPCEPIRYVVNLDDAPSDGLQDLQRAVGDIAEASGLRFMSEGETDERPARRRPAYQPDRYGERWAPVLVAWATDQDGVDLAPGDYGRAGPVAVDSPDGGRVYVSGQVAMNADRFDRASLRHYAVLLHEIGHVVGLGHVDDGREIMNHHATARATELGRGDREGLRRIGAEAGCVAVPSPPGEPGA